MNASNPRAVRPTQVTERNRELMDPLDRERGSSPLPAGACGAKFDRIAPSLRDARMLDPCARPSGHSGACENTRGMSWGTRATASRTTTTRSTQEKKPMKTAELKVRMQQLERQHFGPRPASRSSSNAPTTYRPSGPVDAARRAISLAKAPPPHGGFLPSQLANGMRALERAGSDLLRLAETKCGGGYRTERAILHGLTADLRAAFTPGAPGAQAPVFRQEDMTRMVRAIGALLEPLETQERLANARRNNVAAAEAAAPLPAPAPHPWG